MKGTIKLNAIRPRAPSTIQPPSYTTRCLPPKRASPYCGPSHHRSTVTYYPIRSHRESIPAKKPSIRMVFSIATQAPPIVRFYSDPEGRTSSSLDPEGRSLQEIWNFSDSALERNHDYIQVLFPLPETSPFNPWAPHVDKATRDAFLADAILRERLFTSFERMAQFYGFDARMNADGTTTVHPKPDFTRLAQRNWLKRFDHNHLRISRIIRSLRVLGLPSTASAFHNALISNADETVSARSKMYWTRAAERPLHLAPDEDDENATGVTWLRGST